MDKNTTLRHTILLSNNNTENVKKKNMIEIYVMIKKSWKYSIRLMLC